MEAIRRTKIDGDVSVGRNADIGGNGSVAGNLTVGHNVVVKGWLDAPNIKGVNKGVFVSVEALDAAYPYPEDGWLAGVGTSTPFAAYVGQDGEWVATGGTIEINVDMTQVSEDVSRLEGEVNSLKADVEKNTDGITEHTEQITTLQNNIGAVAQSVNKAVSDAETANRTAEGAETAADTALLAAGEAKTMAETANRTAEGAETAADTALSAAGEAKTMAETANRTAEGAETAADTALSAADTALSSAGEAKTTAEMALAGCTARFSEIVEYGRLETMSTMTGGGRIVYIRNLKVFAYAVATGLLGSKYYSNWMAEGVPPVSMYMSENLLEVLKDKVYLCEGVAYVWDDAKGDLVRQSDGYSHRVLSEAEYEALEVKDENTIYMIYEEE